MTSILHINTALIHYTSNCITGLGSELEHIILKNTHIRNRTAERERQSASLLFIQLNSCHRYRVVMMCRSYDLSVVLDAGLYKDTVFRFTPNITCDFKSQLTVIFMFVR